jgi:hypothetical protein
MKRTISILTSIVFIILIIVSCKKKDDSSGPELFSSTTWRRSQILHRPEATGWTGWTTCSVYNIYGSNGGFTWQDECDASKTLSGSWAWTIDEKELHVNVQSSAILSKKVKIILLSDTLLHTIEIYDNQMGFPEDYWELLYKPLNK